jgi:hypothetical protein
MEEMLFPSHGDADGATRGFGMGGVHEPGSRTPGRRRVGSWTGALANGVVTAYAGADFECLLLRRPRPRRTTSPAVVLRRRRERPTCGRFSRTTRQGLILRKWSRHPLPWRNTPSGGENHLTDANGRRVYDGLDAAEMFRPYAGAAQAPALLDTDRTRRRGPGTGGNGMSVRRPGFIGCCTAGRREVHRARTVVNRRASPRTAPPGETVKRAPVAMGTQR